MAMHERYKAAVADLTAAGITYVLDTTALSGGDAWSHARQQHAGPLAVAYVHHGYWYGDQLRHDDGYPLDRLWVSFQHDDTEIPRTITAAFSAHGFDAEWSGAPEHAVEVRLV